MPELAVSSWSLHRALGPVYREPSYSGGERPAEYPYGEGELTLLDLPARLNREGIHNLEICHFHFPLTDPVYLHELRHNLKLNGIELKTILIDSGDITAADPAARGKDIDWMGGWIDIAAQVGAERVRIIAGRAEPSAEAVQRSVDALRGLSRYARSHDLDVITENWYSLTMSPETLLQILNQLQGRVGLCADFGNFGNDRGPEKYEKLRKILPRAASIHAKAHYPEAGRVDRDDFIRCLDLSREANFAGTYVLIFDGPGDEWASLTEMASIVKGYL